MTARAVLADLQRVDNDLRHYAAHLNGCQPDEILSRAYVAACRGNVPIVDRAGPSPAMCREVLLASPPLELVTPGEGHCLLGRALASMPPAPRASLLLTSMDGITIDDAASVLGMPRAEVRQERRLGANEVRRHVPALRDADDDAVGQAVRALPVAPPSPSFWSELEDQLSDGSEPPPPPPRLASGPVLTVSEGWTERSAPVETLKVALLFGAAVAGLIYFLNAYVLPDPSTAEAELQTAPAALAATSTDDQPPAPVLTDRGRIRFDDGVAILSGTLSAGSVDVWQIEVDEGETMSLATAGLGDARLRVLRDDGTGVGTYFADSGLRIYSDSGDLTLMFRLDRAEGFTAYSIGVSVSGASFGFLTNLEDRGVAVSALQLSSCELVGNRLEASLRTAAGGLHVVANSRGPGGDTVTWFGASSATAEIESVETIPSGLVVTGDIVAGSDRLVGHPFWLGLYGCTEDGTEGDAEDDS